MQLRILGVDVSARDSAGTTFTASVRSQVDSLPGLDLPPAKGTPHWAQVPAPRAPVRHVFSISGSVVRASNGKPIADGARVTLRNSRNGSSRTATVRHGRYTLILADPKQAVARAGDVFTVSVSAAANATFPVSPESFVLQNRDIGIGRRNQNLRVFLSDADLQDTPVDLLPGLNLVSVPVKLVTTNGAPPDAEQLAHEVGASFIVRPRPSGHGYDVYIPGLSNPFPISGNEGYIQSRKGGASTHHFKGVQWSETDVNRRVNRGVNFIGYPRGVPANHNARDLARQVGAHFVIRTEMGRDGRGHFGVFLPDGGGKAFPIVAGAGYLLGSDRSTPITLEHR